ncbi:MAG: hypothetical protein QGF74_00275 [Candidatus Nanoarchaeia archaeon]|jgi:hypothetical protein|nr:hypothetical protein [Candidatus Nanoarchaeia archaeon]|tara:strand:+ start:62450 stop:62707 length:258 start_codon:yes stop_codon:yes gene_type:complete
MSLDFRLSDLQSRGIAGTSQNVAKTMVMMGGLVSIVEHPTFGTILVAGAGLTMANRDYIRFLRRIGKEIVYIGERLRSKSDMGEY